MAVSNFDAEFYAGLVAVVGTAASVWREGHVPQGQREPYVTYARLSSDPVDTLNGTTDMALNTYRVEVRAKSDEQATTIEDLLWAGLHMQGVVGGAAGWRNSRVMDASDGVDLEGEGSEARQSVRVLDVDIQWRRATLSFP